ncbi:zinc-binding dehydrogenase [Gracilibacillus phocaeensis]|uniref:zinc-binding dehydrogenase n=1 Tax=Gracilibacillus phocaeensis TaxID=2042304 RepID=UPI0010309CC6|nr:zinc-binding dehydrogenase [Gracilibacillus phocaeensis]
MSKIKSKAHRLTAPGKFETVELNHQFNPGDVVVQPILASICHADLRYYTGSRKKEVLDKKLPMALFHEGLGELVLDGDRGLRMKENVIIVPNIAKGFQEIENKNTQDQKKIKKEDNYSPESLFLGSGVDGIGQSHLVLPKENVVPIPKDIPDEIAVLAELNSVSLHAISHINGDLSKKKIAVFGDGPVGFLTAAILRHIYKIPRSHLIVFGADQEKLVQFDFATTYMVQEYDFKKPSDVEIILECTGGNFSESAIDQAIEFIQPKGEIVLLGVTENKVPINTRDVLEKGLTIYGSSRSTIKEFKELMKYFKDPDYQNTLRKILPDQNVIIKNSMDLKNVMDKVVENKGWKKTILTFKWE